MEDFKRQNQRKWTTIYEQPSELLTDISTLILPTNLRDFQPFYTIFQFRFGIIKVATSGSNVAKRRHFENQSKKSEFSNQGTWNQPY